MKRTTWRATSVLLLLLALAPLPHAAATPFRTPTQKPQEADRLSRTGQEQLQKGQWKKAAENFQKALRAQPEHAEAHYGLGVAQTRLGLTQEALASFSNVIRLKPNPRVGEALRGSGAIFFAQQQFKQAADCFELALQLGELPPAEHYLLGKAYLQLARARDALVPLKRATTDPQFAQDAFYSIGFIHLSQNENVEAISALEQAARLNPRHAPSLMLLGNAYVTQERYQQAHDLLRQSLSLDPNQFFTHYGLGYALMNLNRAEEAVGSFTAALRLQPQSPEALVGLGNAHLRLNRYREAQTTFEQALRVKADSADALLGMCVVHYSQGRYQDLLTVSQQAVGLAPNNANAQTMLAASQATVGQMREALQSVREAVRLEPNNYWPHHVLGFIHVREDRPQDALAAARVAARLKPNYPETNNLLSYILNQLGQHTEAVEAAQAALKHKREPADEGWGNYNLATAFDKLGRREEALAAFRQSLSAYQQVGRTLDPDDLYLMGNAYLQLDQDRQAIAAFTQAIRVRPNFAQARYNLGVSYFATGNRKGALDELSALKRLDPERAERLSRVINGKPARRR